MTGRCIYFVKPAGMEGPIKIGCSSIPLDRVSRLAEWSPVPLEVIGAVAGDYADENYLHSCFADIHSHHEWFHPTPELLDIIARIIDLGSVAAVADQISPKGSIRPRRNGAPNWLHPYTAAEQKMLEVRHEMMRKGLKEWREPDDIAQMMIRWRGDPSRGIRGKTPSDEEQHRLAEFFETPWLHCVAPSSPLVVPHEVGQLCEEQAA